MFYHLILTDECNLCCSYCRGKTFVPDKTVTDTEVVYDPELPVELDFDLDKLYRFLEKDPDAVLTFYGGEPLIRSDLIHRIVREAPVKRFMIQTNGTLLQNLDPGIIQKFETILVSVDGPEEVTDACRGKGTYQRVINNIRWIRDDGFPGEIIARMTVTEKHDIYKAVTFLSSNHDFSFSSIHWQVDANFWHDFQSRNFPEWVETSYNPGIIRLVRYWVTHMKNTGEVLRWYPFLDPMEDLLNGTGSDLRCGAGYANYSIMTDGSIAPCPVMVGMKDYYLGNIGTTGPAGLRRITVRGRCRECPIVGFCGGRCLYSNIVKPWADNESALVCGTVHNLFRALEAVRPEIENLVKDGSIAPGAFSHTKFNGCEIIP